MPERFEDAIKALRHIARGNGNVLRIADRIVAAHEREVAAERTKAFMGWDEHRVAPDQTSGESRAPITTELRDTIERAGCAFVNSAGFEQVNVTKDALDSMLDAIDSVHASLEQENSDLKLKFIDANRRSILFEHEVEDLKAQIGRALDESVPMTEENMAEQGWVRLPKDADNEYIHFGDDMEVVGGHFAGEHGAVGYLAITEDGWEVDGEPPQSLRHYHAPAVEDVLWEMTHDWCDAACAGKMTTAERDAAREAVIAKYAAKLQLVGDAE